jgi:probable rRNA maturation factor
MLTVFFKFALTAIFSYAKIRGMNCDISIQIDYLFHDKIDTALLEKTAIATLEIVKDADSFELGLVITDDANIHRMNREYRGIDGPTDVISFALLEGEEFVMPPDQTLHLGDIVISYPRALEQAVEQKHTVERELTWLVTHGVLHLLGYDHETDEDRQHMQDIETGIIGRIES